MEREYEVHFCIFCGRKSYLSILMKYIQIGLYENCIDYLHLMNFTRNMNDYLYLYELYTTFIELFPNRIYLHYHEENKELLERKEKKILWNEFYKRLGDEIGNENSVIIKCDDDILFIDIYQLRESCKIRWNDRTSFLIHSNCINNGVCSYYQRNKYHKNIKILLDEYPKKGICGPLFENAKMVYYIHQHFTSCFLENENIIEALQSFYLEEDVYITTRISINFVLLHGFDIPYLKQIGINDEYELSSYYPELLFRPNRILHQMITSHYSYSPQERYLKRFHSIFLSKYQQVYQSYIKQMGWDKITIGNNRNHVNIPQLHIIDDIDKVYRIRNPYKKGYYYIKDMKSGYYLYYDRDMNRMILSEDRKTFFRIKNRVNMDGERVYQMYDSIYPMTRYSLPNQIKNEFLYLKYIQNVKESYVFIKKGEEGYKIQLCKDLLYLSSEPHIGFRKDFSYYEMEKVNMDMEYIDVIRIQNESHFYYKEINLGIEFHLDCHSWILPEILY